MPVIRAQPWSDPVWYVRLSNTIFLAPSVICVLLFRARNYNSKTPNVSTPNIHARTSKTGTPHKKSLQRLQWLKVQADNEEEFAHRRS